MSISVARGLANARTFCATGISQGAYARDKDGKRVHSSDTNAACWCPLGAMLKASAASSALYQGMVEAFTRVINRKSPRRWTIPDWTDEPGRTKEQVLAAFDEAISDTKIPEAA